jgi:hypothetical protein
MLPRLALRLIQGLSVEVRMPVKLATYAAVFRVLFAVNSEAACNQSRSANLSCLLIIMLLPATHWLKWAISCLSPT